MKKEIRWDLIDDSFILTDREVDGIQKILSVSRDHEVIRLLSDRLIKHKFAKELRMLRRSSFHTARKIKCNRK